MTNDPLNVSYLESWVRSGAHWRVVEITDRRAVVDLCACTGEPVERRQSDDPLVVAYLHAARSDLDIA
jgi:hypothetical protein